MKDSERYSSSRIVLVFWFFASFIVLESKQDRRYNPIVSAHQGGGFEISLAGHTHDTSTRFTQGVRLLRLPVEVPAWLSATMCA